MSSNLLDKAISISLPDSDDEQSIVKSNRYYKVVNFNETFGAICFNTPQPNIFVDLPKVVKLRYDLISEEISELHTGVTKNDRVEMIDALADILYVVYGAASAFGLNLSDIDNKIVIMSSENLMSYYTMIYNDNVSFKNAIDNKNLDEAEKYLRNLVTDVYTMASYLDFNLDKAFDIVHKSNMSKLCVSETQAKRTVNWYLTSDDAPRTLDGKLVYDTPEYKLSHDSAYWIVYNKSSGKILKSIDYYPANLNNL